MDILVTGGAGLVGSTLCGKLLDRGARVLCVDNLVLGTKRHLDDVSSRSDFSFEQWDVSEQGWHKKLSGKKFDLIVHLAANSDISVGNANPTLDCQRTFSTTLATLVAAKELKVKNFIFSSTSAVYGADPEFPTPENTTSMHPVSIYGAGKLASEGFISAFVENYSLNAWVFRFGNVVGKNLTHGVIFDFVRKLTQDPAHLNVLGNGTQKKTYIDVNDCVAGILHGFDKSPARKDHKDRFQIFNLSTRGQTSVREIAEQTVKVVTQGKTQITYESSPIGWVGDVSKTELNVDKIFNLGWKPKIDSTAAVFTAIQDYYDWSRQK